MVTLSFVLTRRLREDRIQGPSISAKTAMESNSYPHGEPTMQHSASSSSSPAVDLTSEEHLAARDSLPREAKTEIKKKKTRQPPLITPAFQHALPVGGLREAARDLNPGESRTVSYVSTIAYMLPGRLHIRHRHRGALILRARVPAGQAPIRNASKSSSTMTTRRSQIFPPSSTGTSVGAVDFVRTCTAINPTKRPAVGNILTQL